MQSVSCSRGVGVARASQWRGPWIKTNGGQSIFPPGVVVGLEDMYAWENPKGVRAGRPGCHMVLHQECQGTENLGAHAFTEQPDCTGGWKLSSPRPSRAYGPEFYWDNGTTTTFDSRERPQLVLDTGSGAGAGAPMFMSNGVITDGWGGRSFTLVAPINSSGWPTAP